MKGIILAGGSGTRLYPLTTVMTKQLLPVYDKPMIYYPLSHLMMLGIREILLICKQEDRVHFHNLLGDGSSLGLKLEYKIQDKPNGIAEAFIIGDQFIGNDPVALILGDNVYYGDYRPFREAMEQFHKGTGPRAKIFGYPIRNPEIYGVVEFNEHGQVLSVEEKPHKPRSNNAIPGFYLFDGSIVERAKNLKPSKRGELEVTDLVRGYLEEQRLTVMPLGRGIAWLDMGSQESLLDASAFIAAIEKRQGVKVACLEEIALNKGFIQLAQFAQIMERTPKGHYRDFLELVYQEKASKLKGPA